MTALEDFLALPLEVLYHILKFVSMQDVVFFSRALNRPSLTDVLREAKMSKSMVLGPRLLETCTGFLSSKVEHLTILGRLRIDKNFKPLKEKFFKSSELLPKFVFDHIGHHCDHLETLIFDQCVLGPHINPAMLPKCLIKLFIRSTIFMKKSSFFKDIWDKLVNLKEIRVENMLNFDKKDFYDLISSPNIDFDIKFSDNDRTPSFVFYKTWICWSLKVVLEIFIENG